MLEKAPNERPLPTNEDALNTAYRKNESLGIDSGIRDTVAYLSALGFHTVESCEGHTDHGIAAPRIIIRAPDCPQYRYKDQKEILEKIAGQHGTTSEEVLEYLRPKYGENVTHDGVKQEELLFNIWEEAFNSTPKEETTEFKIWRVKTDAAKDSLNALLDEFYSQTKATADFKLIIRPRDPNESSDGYWLTNLDAINLPNIDPDERHMYDQNIIEKDLRNRQKEMSDFTEFLKRKYIEV